MNNQIKTIKLQMLDLTYQHLRVTESLKRIELSNIIMKHQVTKLK